MATPAKARTQMVMLDVAPERLNQVVQAIRDLDLAGLDPSGPVAAGGPISGSSCEPTGPKLKPNDFNCGDSD